MICKIAILHKYDSPILRLCKNEVLPNCDYASMWFCNIAILHKDDSAKWRFYTLYDFAILQLRKNKFYKIAIMYECDSAQLRFYKIQILKNLYWAKLRFPLYHSAKPVKVYSVVMCNFQMKTCDTRRFVWTFAALCADGQLLIVNRERIKDPCDFRKKPEKV